MRIHFYVRNLVYKVVKNYSQATPAVQELCPSYIELSDAFNENTDEIRSSFINSVTVYQNFFSELEEKSIMTEIEPYLKRMRYQFDHWDDAIHGYRETERLHWNPVNRQIIDKIRKTAFRHGDEQLKAVHILDLDKNGYIKPHIDAVRFCGDTVAGVSLLTDSVMRFVHEKNKELYANVLLERHSLYVMKGSARYDYTHELLKNDVSKFKGKHIVKDRRISIICRNQPLPKNKN